jgi:isoquinoline 1-oxidoreductase subunit alpha
MEVTVNGVRHRIDADAEMPLLWVVRDLIGLRGTKFGCGVGACGACTVHIDGVAVRSCITPVADVRGKAVTTIEGLGQGREHPVQRAWKAANVPQCGYCQAGQMMQAASLLKQKPRPTDDDIVDAMAGNICRCGTYQRIKAAIKAAAHEAAPEASRDAGKETA